MMFWIGLSLGIGLLVGFICGMFYVAPSTKPYNSEIDREKLDKIIDYNRNYFNNPVVNHLKDTDRKL